MRKLQALRNILLLAAFGLSLSLSSQNIVWETNFGSEEAFSQWQVVDANNDGVTWGYEPGLSPSPVVYRYHYTNPADDWLISPIITANVASQLMVKYVYVGSFYSEEMEVYYGSSPTLETMKKLAVHADLKDKTYESYVFFDVEAGETFHLAFRATSPAYKQQLFLSSVQVAIVGSNVANDYPNRVTSSSGLTLASTKKYVEADDATQVDLVVFDGTENVTNFAEIYVRTPDGEDVRLEDSNYICAEVGEYLFYANHAEKSSADAPLTVQVFHSIPALPRDEQPESEEFLRRVLLLQGTGVHCGYCPNGIAAIRRFYAGHEQADRVCHIAYHSYTESDPLYCDAAEVLSSQTQLRAYPNMMVNFNDDWGTTGLGEDGFVTWLNETVEKALEGKSSTNIALSTAYCEETGTISVNVGVKAFEAGLFRITVALLQDSVYNWQSGAPSVDFYTHNASVRALAPANGEGAYLNCGKSEEAGEVYQYVCEFDPGLLVQDRSVEGAFSVERHARIVVYVRRLDGLVDNVATCAINDSVSFAYTSVAPEVPPVGISELTMDTSTLSSEVEIYDLAGNRIGVSSTLEKQKASLSGGVYIVREKRGKNFNVRKIIIP